MCCLADMKGFIDVLIKLYMELIYSLLKSLILKFVKNVKS